MTLGRILVSESEIAQAIAQIAEKIVEDYGDADLVIIGVMDGAVCFLSDLIRAFPRSVNVVTARMSSYDGSESSGEVNIGWLPTREKIAGRHALIVEDIVDTGATIAALTDSLTALGAASVNVCALLDKPARRKHDVEVTYVGFDLPNVFVVGYGLDYNGEFRNLRDVRELDGGK